MKSEEEIRALLKEYENQLWNPKINKTGMTILYTRIATLGWVLSEENDDE